jgi:hypothetical protein
MIMSHAVIGGGDKLVPEVPSVVIVPEIEYPFWRGE